MKKTQMSVTSVEEQSNKFKKNVLTHDAIFPSNHIVLDPSTA